MNVRPPLPWLLAATIALATCDDPPPPGHCTDSADCLPDDRPCTEAACEAGRCVQVPANAGVECRAAAGACDLAERCSGTSLACPLDAKSREVCRPMAAACDEIERCDGAGDDCPPDGKSTLECRAIHGDCDTPEICDGTGDACPPDEKLSGEICRPAAGPCDFAEKCDGVGDWCPPDVDLPDGSPCADGSCVEGECLPP